MKAIFLLAPIFALACARPVTSPQPPRIDPAIVEAIVLVESSGNPKAIGKRGEIGLMQVMPATGRALGYSRADLFDPATNMEAGTRYLTILLDDLGHIELALAAYNCGPAKHKRPACRAYARKVLRQI